MIKTLHLPAHDSVVINRDLKKKKYHSFTFSMVAFIFGSRVLFCLGCKSLVHVRSSLGACVSVS